MKKKTKLILTSVATIAMSASLIAGGTFALFTDKASVNVAVQAGDVDIEAYVVEKSLETFSIAWNDSIADYESLPTAQVGVFTNGGTAAFNDDYSELKLDLVSPGDSVKFTIDVENKSNISIQYRVVMEVEGTLADALVATAEIEGEVYAIDGVDTKATLWKGIPGGQAIEDINVEIDFPNADDNNEFKNASATTKYSVEAVQGNGHVVDHKVDATTKLQNAFTAGGNVEAPDLLLQPTETVWVGRNDVCLARQLLPTLINPRNLCLALS
jgi:predicted ribosomally synthesized peptide with SipW-like signal peptide